MDYKKKGAISSLRQLIGNGFVDLRKRLQFQKFYLSAKEDTRSQTAKTADYIMGRVILFFLVFLAALLYYRQLLGAVVVTTIFVSLFHFWSVALRNWRLEGIKLQKRKLLAEKKVYQDLVNRTDEELKPYLETLYTNMGCTNLQFLHSSSREISYQASFGGQSLQLVCYLHKGDYEVELKDVKTVQKEMERKQVKFGLLFSTSDFTKECQTYVTGLTGAWRIRLFNRGSLLRLLHENKLFPTEQEIDGLLENQLRREQIRWKKYRQTIVSRHKAKNYLLLGIFLFWVGALTPYPLYYYAMVGVSFTMTLLTLLAQLTHRQTETTPLALQDMLKE